MAPARQARQLPSPSMQRSICFLPTTAELAELPSMKTAEPPRRGMDRFICAFAYALLAATILAGGCRKSADEKRLEQIEQSVSRLTKEIEAHSKQISELQRQALATPLANEGRSHQIITADPSDRFKKQIASFVPAYEAWSKGGSWAEYLVSVVSYDIRKTDSIVTPLYGTLLIDQDDKSNPAVRLRFAASFALQEGEWILKVLKVTIYDKAQMKEAHTDEVSINNPADSGYAFSQFLRAHFTVGHRVVAKALFSQRGRASAVDHERGTHRRQGGEGGCGQ